MESNLIFFLKKPSLQNLERVIENAKNPLCLYSAASYLQFEPLMELCIEKKLSDYVCVGNVFEIIEFAGMYQLFGDLETPILNCLQGFKK